MWVRNGTTLRYQSALYGQSHFCTALLDQDIFMLQVFNRSIYRSIASNEYPRTFFLDLCSSGPPWLADSDVVGAIPFGPMVVVRSHSTPSTISASWMACAYVGRRPSTPCNNHIATIESRQGVEGERWELCGYTVMRYWCAGMSEEDATRLELATLLAMGEKTHSQLMEHLPDKGINNISSNKYFEPTLKKVRNW